MCFVYSFISNRFIQNLEGTCMDSGKLCSACPLFLEQISNQKFVSKTPITLLQQPRHRSSGCVLKFQQIRYFLQHLTLLESSQNSSMVQIHLLINFLNQILCTKPVRNRATVGYCYFIKKFQWEKNFKYSQKHL